MTLLRSSQGSVAPWCGGKRLILNVYGRTVRITVSFLPPPASKAETIADFMVLGHIMTAMPTINAIAAVVSAAPGIVTYTDRPLTLPRGVVAF
jgi:2,4-diaminopentanoate dehydrogenase